MGWLGCVWPTLCESVRLRSYASPESQTDAMELHRRLGTKYAQSKGLFLCHRIIHGTNKYITEDNHSRGGLFIIHQPSCSTANIPNGLLSTLNLKKLTRSQQAHTSLHCNSPSLSTYTYTAALYMGALSHVWPCQESAMDAWWCLFSSADLSHNTANIWVPERKQSGIFQALKSFKSPPHYSFGPALILYCNPSV